MQPQDPQNPVTPEQPPVAPTEPMPAETPAMPETPPHPETPPAEPTPVVQAAPDANAVPGGIVPPAAPVMSSPEPAPVADDKPVMSFNSMANKRKSPLIPIIVTVVVLLVVVAGSLFGVMFAANASASSYKTTLAKQWNDNHDAFNNVDSTSINGVQDAKKIFDKVVKEKPSLVALPFAANLSSDYKKMQDADKEVTQYYKDGEVFIDDILAVVQYNQITTDVGNGDVSNMASFAAVLDTASGKMKQIKTDTANVKQMIKLATEFYDKLSSDLKAGSDAKFEADFSALGSGVTNAETAVFNSFQTRSDNLSKSRDDIEKKIGAKSGLGSESTKDKSVTSGTVKL